MKKTIRSGSDKVSSTKKKTLKKSGKMTSGGASEEGDRFAKELKKFLESLAKN